MKIKIQFFLSKGDGDWPDLTLLNPNQKNLDYLTSCMEFMPAFEDVESVILDWSLINVGLSNFEFSEGELVGYPKPVVEFNIDEKRYNELIKDSNDFLKGVWESTYKFAIPGINEEDPFYFADFNGYSKIINSL
jgi:hypothetical protein